MAVRIAISQLKGAELLLSGLGKLLIGGVRGWGLHSYLQSLPFSFSSLLLPSTWEKAPWDL